LGEKPQLGAEPVLSETMPRRTEAPISSSPIMIEAAGSDPARLPDAPFHPL
jgi:hypothetical protein